jgi:hypothetical protein
MKSSALLIIWEGETRLTVCVGQTLMVFCTVLWLVQLIGRKEAFTVMQEQLQFGVGTPLHANIWLSEQLVLLWLCTSISKYLQSQKFVSCKPHVMGLWHHVHTKLNHWECRMLLWPGMPYCRVVVPSVRMQIGKCARISGQQTVIFIRHVFLYKELLIWHVVVMWTVILEWWVILCVHNVLAFVPQVTSVLYQDCCSDSLQLPWTRTNRFSVAWLHTFSSCSDITEVWGGGCGGIFCILKCFGLLVQDMVHCARFKEHGVEYHYIPIVHMFIRFVV